MYFQHTAARIDQFLALFRDIEVGKRKIDLARLQRRIRPSKFMSVISIFCQDAGKQPTQLDIQTGQFPFAWNEKGSMVAQVPILKVPFPGVPLIGVICGVTDILNQSIWLSAA